MCVLKDKDIILDSGDMPSLQHYVMNFVCDLQQGCCFLNVFWFSSPLKLTTMI